jgi:hypothetical protein
MMIPLKHLDKRKCKAYDYFLNVNKVLSNKIVTVHEVVEHSVHLRVKMNRESFQI